MNAYQVKKFLIKKGLTVAQMAREIAEETGRSESGTRNRLDGLLYRGIFSPTLAKIVQEKYGLEIKRSSTSQPMREILRQAA